MVVSEKPHEYATLKWFDLESMEMDVMPIGVFSNIIVRDFQNNEVGLENFYLKNSKIFILWECQVNWVC